MTDARQLQGRCAGTAAGIHRAGLQQTADQHVLQCRLLRIGHGLTCPRAGGQAHDERPDPQVAIVNHLDGDVAHPRFGFITRTLGDFQRCRLVFARCRQRPHAPLAIGSAVALGVVRSALALQQ